jgi:uncharacterized coiled-coil DUF342 family protein
MTMAQTSTVTKLKQTETELAVLQVQYGYLNENVAGIKADLKGLQSSIDTHMAEMKNSLESFKEDNKKQHKEVNDKISSLEKWKWMLMGAGVLAGAMGWTTLSKLLGM